MRGREPGDRFDPHGRTAHRETGEAGGTSWRVASTGINREEFRQAGAEVTGLRESRRALAAKINAGDVLTRHLTGIKRCVGALAVLDPTDASGLLVPRGEGRTVRRRTGRAVTKT